MSGRALVSPSAGSQAPPSSTEASPRGPSASMPALPPVRPDIVIKGQGGFPDVVLKQGGRLHHSTSLPTLRMKKMVLVGPGAVVGQSARGGVGPGGDGPGPIVGQSLQSLHGGNGADGGGGPGGPSASSPSPPRRGRLSEADASRQAEVRLSSPEPRIVRRHGGRTVGRPHARPSALLPSLEPVRHRPAGPDEKEAALTQQEQQALRERRRLIREKARSWIDAAEAAEADAIGANLVMAGASGGDALGGAGGGQPGSTVDPMSKGVWGPLHRGAYLHVHLPTYLLPYFLTYLLTYLMKVCSIGEPTRPSSAPSAVPSPRAPRCACGSADGPSRSSAGWRTRSRCSGSTHSESASTPRSWAAGSSAPSVSSRHAAAPPPWRPRGRWREMTSGALATRGRLRMMTTRRRPTAATRWPALTRGTRAAARARARGHPRRSSPGSPRGLAL